MVSWSCEEAHDPSEGLVGIRGRLGMMKRGKGVGTTAVAVADGDRDETRPSKAS